MSRGDFRQDTAGAAVRAGKVPVTERAIGDDGEAVPLAPGKHRMLDGPLV
jgi:hypothetical protein